MDAKAGFLTVRDIAARLSVHPNTVKNWLRSGQLEGLLLGDRAGWRVTEEQLQRFLSRKEDETRGKDAA